MTKMSNKHTLTFKDCPQMDRRDMVDSMKGFKNSSFPKNPFKDSTPQTKTDAAYTPFKGKEPR